MTDDDGEMWIPVAMLSLMVTNDARTDSRCRDLDVPYKSEALIETS